MQKQPWYSEAGAKCDSEVPTDWAHSQMHVTKTQGSIPRCSFLIKNRTNLTLAEADPQCVFVLTSCAYMSLQ